MTRKVLVLLFAAGWSGVAVGAGAPTGRPGVMSKRAAPAAAASAEFQGLIPMAADNAGKLGTYFQTTVWASQDAVAQATLSLCASNNVHPAVPAECRQIALPRGQVVTLENAWQGFPAPPPGGFLWSVAGIDPEQLALFSRTYTVAPSARPGTLGQGGPSLIIAQLPAAGTSLYVPTHVRNGFRTNVGLFNATAQLSRVLVILHDSGGNELGRKVYNLPGYGWQQLNDVFAELGVPAVTNAYVEVFQRSGDSMAVYSSVVDNTSGDPTTFLAKTAYAGPQPLFVPIVAHLPGFNLTSWVTDLTYLNVSVDDQSTAELVYLPQATDNVENPTLRRTWILGSGALSSFPDVLASLFGVTGSKGSFRSTPVDSHLVWARTFNDRGTDGTAGQEFPTIFGDDEAIEGSVEGVLIGLSESADTTVGFRSAVGLLNTGAVAATFHVELFDDVGPSLGAFDQVVPPMSVIQIDRVYRKVTANGVTNGRVKVTVTQGEGFAYASIVDNQSGDPTTEYATLVAKPE